MGNTYKKERAGAAASGLALACTWAVGHGRGRLSKKVKMLAPTCLAASFFTTALFCVFFFSVIGITSGVHNRRSLSSWSGQSLHVQRAQLAHSLSKQLRSHLIFCFYIENTQRMQDKCSVQAASNSKFL